VGRLKRRSREERNRGERGTEEQKRGWSLTKKDPS
jgi:hypothetical protein